MELKSGQQALQTDQTLKGLVSESATAHYYAGKS